jgi:hypothetical protein
MKKQTAVEWLVEQLNTLEILVDKESQEKAIEIFDQALAIEKEQIIDAYLNGAEACDLEVKGDKVLLVKPDTNFSGQEYYHQNF